MIENSSQFRTRARFPVASWIHPDTGAAMCRSSQPKVGFGKRDKHDEMYVGMLQRPREAPRASGSASEDGEGSQTSESCHALQRGVVIFDCRPFANAMANRSRAGGYEDERYYTGCTYYNADLGNIHDITSSLKLLRRLVEAPPLPSNGGWITAFHQTGWVRHLEKIIVASIKVVGLVEGGASVLIHCSDGWDRTSQVVTLAKMMIDPYYRTIEGFQVLLRQDWLAAGHKFADRHFNVERESSMGRSEMSPIFLQWMDCVYQLWRQYPTLFEFTDQYLIYILYHSTSGRFATFMYNSEKERREGNIGLSLWAHLNAPEQRYHRPEFLNLLYSGQPTVIRPANWPKMLTFWEEVHGQIDYDWTDQLWQEPVGEKLLLIGRELEDHRNKRPKLEAALKKRMSSLNNFTTVRHLADLVDDRKGDVSYIRQFVEEVLLERVFDEIDVRETGTNDQDLHARNPYKGKASAVHSRWVPDNMAPCCAACLRPFMWWRRRHHCRICGHVFCSAHSSNRCPLPDRPYAGYVRVCDDCAKEVHASRSRSRSPSQSQRSQVSGTRSHSRGQTHTRAASVQADTPTSLTRSVSREACQAGPPALR
eukprot:TRINITY_DN15171_c0_g3_i1.p1 TRINITY_DN15171_c0_g3~~TRINITY_DN15171_c0_g3_i1.p1  ORF type:complete len:692 (+),score=224.42 TRINITY_DN15171_c0_g3_i1:298-2076(+)